MMTSKEAKTHIIDTINGDMNKEYFINEILPEVLKDLDQLEELQKENQELIKKADCCLWHDCNKISQENTKLKKAIEILFGENGTVLLGSDNKHKLHLIDYDLVKYFISKENYYLLNEALNERGN